MPERLRGFTNRRYINPLYLYLYLYQWCTKVRAVVTVRSISGYDLPCFSSLSYERLCIFYLHSAINIVILWLHLFLYLSVSWAWWNWLMTWFSNRCRSVLLRCWLGHNTRTSSSAVAKRPRDTSCMSVVSFNSTKRRVESFIVSYVCTDLSLRAVKCAVLLSLA